MRNIPNFPPHSIKPIANYIFTYIDFVTPTGKVILNQGELTIVGEVEAKDFAKVLVEQIFKFHNYIIMLVMEML